MDMLTGLHQLQHEGMTREMYIWGNVQARHVCAPAAMLLPVQVTYSLLQGHWLRGIIDQLELDKSGQIRVVENKTRRKPSLPMLAQQETAKLQVRATSAQTCRKFEPSIPLPLQIKQVVSNRQVCCTVHVVC